MSNTARACVALLIALASAACGPIRPNAGGEPAVIVFHNNAFDEAAVYVVGQAADFRRVATVSAGRTERIKIPADLIRGPVNIVARMLARYELPSTGAVTLYPGDVYDVTLPMDAKMLTFLPSRTQ